MGKKNIANIILDGIPDDMRTWFLGLIFRINFHNCYSLKNTSSRRAAHAKSYGVGGLRPWTSVISMCYPFISDCGCSPFTRLLVQKYCFLVKVACLLKGLH